MGFLEDMAARAGVSVADIHGSARMAGSTEPEVWRGPEWRRVNALPTWDVEPPDLVQRLTHGLRTPWGTRVLRPIQARAIYGMILCRGGFYEIEAGGGKTDLTALAPTVLGLRRPLLILPKNMEKETKRKFEGLNDEWVMPHWEAYKMVSYQFLASPSQGTILDPATGALAQEDFLERYQPDGIIADEAHHLSSLDTVAWTRLERYLETGIPFLAMSATFGDLSRYGHLVSAALRQGAPVARRCPAHYREFQLWCQAIDHKTEVRAAPGALLEWCTPEERAEAYTGPGGTPTPESTRAARWGFQRRFTSTVGVVVSPDEPLDLPLSIEPLDPYVTTGGDPCPKIEAAMKLLRTARITPSADPVTFGDDPVADGKEEWAHERQLTGCGLSYTWDPPAPKEWRESRTETFSWARRAVRENDIKADSWKPLKDAVAAGRIDDGGLIARWLAIEPTFTPNPVPVWVSDEPLNAAATWIANHSDGVVWTEHSFFAERLAKVAGVPYFGELGLNKAGDFILDHKGPCIASIFANGAGRNMQLPENGWASMLYMCFPQNEKAAEQSMARIHRVGQTAPAVRVFAWIGGFVLAKAYWEARAGAQAQADHKGVSRRVLYAENRGMPRLEDVVKRGGYRWRR